MLIRVRLLRKLAESLNGVDVSKVEVGDHLDLPQHSARLLIAEGWAELVQPLAPHDPEDLKNR